MTKLRTTHTQRRTHLDAADGTVPTSNQSGVRRDVKSRSDSYGNTGGTRKTLSTIDRAQQQAKRSKSGLAAILGGLGAGRIRKMGAAAALIFGAATMVTTPAMADYVRIDQDAPQIVVSATVNPAILVGATLGEDAFDPGQLEEYPLFKMFIGSDVPGMLDHGRAALTPEGVSHLLEYARTHSLDGRALENSSPRSGPIAVTAGHQALIKHLIGHNDYAGAITQEALPILRAAFALQEADGEQRPEHQPVDAGTVRVCSQEEWWGSRGIETWMMVNLPSAMVTEYGLGSGIGRYDGAALSVEQQKYEMTCLLQQFGTSLNSVDDLAPDDREQRKHQVQEELLDRFFGLPAFSGPNGDELRRFFATDFNGSGMGLAQAIAKGFDPNDYTSEFPNASGRDSPVYLSLSTSNLAGAMTLLDELRVAAGMQPAAVELKNLPTINYMVGEPSGHDNVSFDERRPPLDRLNYGKMIEIGSQAEGFRTDPRLRNLPPTNGFTFPIDGLTVTGLAIIATDQTGLEVHRASDNSRLTVTPKFETNDAGQEVSWSLVFTDAAGTAVPADEVVGILRGAKSQGDGLANQSLYMGYWGRCDDNTGADAIFGRFSALPQAFTGQEPDGKRMFIRTGNVISAVPLARAQELVYMDLPGIGNTEFPRFAGFRYGEDPSEIRWQRGDTINTNFGAIEGFDPSPFNQSTHEFVYNDHLRIPSTPQAPLLGTLRLETSPGGKPTILQGADVQSIVRLEDGSVKVFYQSGSSISSKTGKPLTDLSHLDWTNQEVSFDPATTTPGRHVRAEADTTVQAYFEAHMQDSSITLPQFLRANAEIVGRAAGTVLPSERVTVPEAQITAAFEGGTMDEFLEKYAPRLPSGAADVDRLAKNIDALRGVATPILTTGQTLQLPIGDTIVEHTVADGETFAGILAAHATTDVSAADIEAKLRADPRGLFSEAAKLTMPTDAEIVLSIAGADIRWEADAPQTLPAIYALTNQEASGVSLEAFVAANQASADRPARWVRASEQLVMPEQALNFNEADPFRGDFFMRRTDGVDITVRADEVQYVQGETPHDVRFTHYVRFVQQAQGVYGNEGSLSRSINNTRKWVNELPVYETRGDDRPDWAGDAALRGISGPLERRDGDKMVFQAGQATSTGRPSTTFAGWYQVDTETGRIINEGFTRGEPDFLWGIHDTGLNWHAPSTYIGNAMVSDFRIGMVVNGIADLRNQTEDGQRIAEELSLPAGWERYIVPQEDIDTFVAAERTQAEAEAVEQARIQAETEAAARRAADAAAQTAPEGQADPQPQATAPAANDAAEPTGTNP